MSFDPRLPPENNVSATHPLAELATLLGGIVLTVVLLTVAASLALGWLVPRFPASWEQRLFGRLWTGMAEAEQTPERTASQALLDRLAAHWEDNPYEALQLGIVEDDAVNAYALPGGMVLVTRGLLDGLGSENELAFVLGHELGHFRERHHLEVLGRGLVVGFTLAALSGAGAEGLPAVATRMTELRFARGMEEEADRFGLRLVVAEYGHAAGASEFFGRLPDAGEDGAGSRIGAWLATHPLSQERARALEAHARERGWPEAGALEDLPWHEWDDPAQPDPES